MWETSRRLCISKWTLRTGGADSADEAFRKGCEFIAPHVELYLPWRGFNGHEDAYLEVPKRAAYDIAARYHPKWPYLKAPVKALMARNVHQVLGLNLDSPVRMVICWTPDGSLDGNGPDSGGTGMALRVAAGEAPMAKVLNLRRPDHRRRVESFCGV